MSITFFLTDNGDDKKYTKKYVIVVLSVAFFSRQRSHGAYTIWFFGLICETRIRGDKRVVGVKNSPFYSLTMVLLHV